MVIDLGNEYDNHIYFFEATKVQKKVKGIIDNVFFTKSEDLLPFKQNSFHNHQNIIFFVSF